VCSLSGATAAFNVPDSLTLGTTATVALVLHRTLSGDSLRVVVGTIVADTNARVQVAAVQVSDRMSAKLEGQGFEITPPDERIQLFASRDTAVWEWQVTPRRGGLQPLRLTVMALVKVGDSETPKRFVVLRRDINVRVTFVQQVALATDWLADHWALVAACGAAAAAGYAALRVRLK
jgi:hypothetical protein